MDKMFKTTQSGRTMIETIGVIGIISMVTMGLIKTVSVMFDKYKQTMAVEQIRSLQKNIRTRYAALNDYSGINFDSLSDDDKKKLIEERTFPSSIVRGNELYNSYGGKIGITSTERTYSITFNYLKAEGCRDLLVIDWAVNNTSDLIELKYGGKTYKWTDNTLPLSMTTAMNVCKNKQSENSITWTFQ